MKCDYCDKEAIYFHNLPYPETSQIKVCPLHVDLRLFYARPLTEENYITLTVEEKINGPSN